MSLVGSQQKVFLRLVSALRPHWRSDANLPARLQALFAANRSFGSRDRKLYRELIFTSLRFLPWIELLLDHDPARAAQVTAWLAADIPATHAFRAALCADWPTCPSSLAAKATHLGADSTALLPDWAGRHCPEAVGSPNLDALHTRAPLWLRLQAPDAGTVLDEFTRQGWGWRRSEILPSAVELLAEGDVTKTESWARGHVEVQDLGSQLLLETIGIGPGEQWLDACAGAGGKTLQLIRLLGPTGHVDAHDIRAGALRELAACATRAGHPVCHLLDDKTPGGIAVRETAPTGHYDGVLVDAPCSGSGTWRRAPHLKWCTSAGAVKHAAETQQTLLAQFASSVRPGGRLVYATCSLSRLENEDVVAQFLTQHPDFSATPFARTFDSTPRTVGLAILPAQHNTDGFYVASLRRKAS